MTGQATIDARSDQEIRFSEDLQLTRLVASADPRARRLYARRTFGRARRIARALLGNNADADDAAQECMLTLLSAAGTYRGQAPLEGWADRVVVRTCRRWSIRVHRLESRVDATVHADQLGASQSSSDLDERLPRPVTDYLDRLPAAQREALVLRHVLGFSVAEISQEVGAKETTVRYRISTGLQTVRALIRCDSFIGVRKEQAQ